MRVLLLVLFLILPAPARGQTPSDPPRENRVSAAATALLKVGRIAEEGRLHAGGWAGLTFGDNFLVGGGGLALLRGVELAGSEGGTGFNLNLGYGGLVFRYWEPLAPRLTGEAGLLLGAGHAEVRDQLTRREVGSDNFLVGEAEMSLVYSILRWVQAGASVGYRLTAGVDDLPRVSAGDLNTFTGTVFVRIGGD